MKCDSDLESIMHNSTGKLSDFRLCQDMDEKQDTNGVLTHGYNALNEAF